MTAEQKRWSTVLVLVTGIFIATMDIFIVNVAIPLIQRDISADDGDLQLIIAAYTLSYGVLLITGSRLGDRYGRKKTFLWGIAGFTMASVLCAVSTEPRQLIGFRALQGFGSALMVPQVLPIIHRLFAEKERQKALGIYGAAIGLGAMIGQMLGGTLIEANLFGLEWRLVFLVNVPVGVAVLVAGVIFINESREERPKSLDVIGVVSLTAALVLLMLPLAASEGIRWKPWMSASLALSLFAGTGFLLLERTVARRGGNPLVHVDLFRTPAYASASAVLLLAQGGLAAFIFVYTIHMQLGLTRSALSVGLSLGGPAIGYTIASLATGSLMRKWGGRVPRLGACLMVVGYGGICAVAVLGGIRLTPGAIVVPLLLTAFGRGLMFTPTIHIALRRVGMEYLGMASGVLNTVFQLANLVGITLVGSLFFAVRHFASGSPSERSSDGFVFACVILTGVAVCGLALLLLSERKQSAGT